ncbi:MAG: histidinol-phosphate transaminase [Pseudomonadota bacterium]
MTDTPQITPQPGIMDIAPYVGGASHVEGAETVIKLSSNENPYGPSPKARAAYEAAISNLADYPDPGCEALRSAIAERHGIEASQIICGNGSDELIALLCQAYAGVGDEVLAPDHSFLLYGICAQANGASPVVAPDVNLSPDVDELLAACTDKTRLVFLANPNNPTGARLNAQELDRLAAGIPEGALLVLDSAYAEYVDADDYDSGIALVRRRENVVMTRTFSKIYGLAALRVGWMYAPDHVLDVLHRIRGPFNVNGAAQAAATAAMQDLDYTASCAERNKASLERLEAGLKALGLTTAPSSANFLLVEFGEDASNGAAAADAHLKSKGIIARPMNSYGLPGHLRISIGDEASVDAVLTALAEFTGQ